MTDPQDDAPPSSEDAEPLSLRDVELEPVSLHDIEKILAPGKPPPRLRTMDPDPAPAESPALAAEEPRTTSEESEELDASAPEGGADGADAGAAETRPSAPAEPAAPQGTAKPSTPPPPPPGGRTRTLQGLSASEGGDDDRPDDEERAPNAKTGTAADRKERPPSDSAELGPDSAITDLRSFTASLPPARPREAKLDEFVALGSTLGDAPQAPLVPPDLAALAREKPEEAGETGAKGKPRPPLKKRGDAPPPLKESDEPPASARDGRRSARPLADAKSVAPKSSRPPAATKTASVAPKAAATSPSERGGGKWLGYLAAGAAFLGVGYFLGSNKAPVAGPAPTVTVVVTQEVPAPAAPPVTAETATADPEPPIEDDLEVVPASPGTGTLPAPDSAAPAASAPVAASASAGPIGGGEFDKAAASTALSGAVAAAAACKQPGDPSGQAKVQVTFAPSGKVTMANILGPPFAGTATGGCIARAFKQATVPPFVGDPATVSKTVSIP